MLLANATAPAAATTRRRHDVNPLCVFMCDESFSLSYRVAFETVVLMWEVGFSAR